MNGEIDKVAILKEVSLFSKLPFEVLYALGHVLEWHDTFEGQLLFSEGNSATGFYIIAQGEINIIKKGKILHRLKQYDFFGEAGILSNDIHPASAIANSSGSLLFMASKHFNDLVMDYPEVLSGIVHNLISQLKILPS